MRVSLRVRNFESSKLKVNDKNGNPIEIAAVIVWEVTDTAEAVFQVDDYEDFVSIQSESALRNLATSYAYDHHEDDDISLRSDPAKISAALKVEVQDRLEKAGVTVTDRGFIDVDKQMRTNVSNIFAIGDLVGQPMLAHKAVHESERVEVHRW